MNLQPYLNFAKQLAYRAGQIAFSYYNNGIQYGCVLTHRSILTHVLGETEADQIEYLQVYLRQLRKKLESDPERSQYILT